MNSVAALLSKCVVKMHKIISKIFDNFSCNFSPKFLILLAFDGVYVIITEHDCTQICVEAEGCGVYVGFSVEYVRS